VKGDVSQTAGTKVGLYGAAPVSRQAGLPSDPGGQGTVGVCTDSTCATKTSVADSSTKNEVDALQQRVKQLEDDLKAYGLLP
jgi:hypothetical protein